MTATIPITRKEGTEEEGVVSSSLKEADAAAGTLPILSKPPKKQKEVATTKRQKRAEINEKHAWPQHPKIQNAQQREKAYVRAAGLLVPPPKQQQQQQQEKGVDDNNNDDAASSSSSSFTLEQNNFARQLGSADARTRHRTVLQLQAYLKARSDVSSSSPSSSAGLSELDLLKLHKCLWYTLYLADRVPVQAELSRHVARLIWSVAGTLEEDEYAAAAYLQLEQEQQNNDDMDDESYESESDSDDNVTMEVIENTLDEDNDSNSDEEEDANSDVDLEDKQVALLQNDVVMEELEPDEEGSDEDEQEEENDDESVGHCRGAHLAALWTRTWLRTIVREWGQMDKYRIDKFYTCLRDTLAVVYEYMAARHWSAGIIHLFNDALYEEVLSQTPNGIRYHVIDVCLEELCKASQKAVLPLTEATFVDVLEPFFAMTQTGAGGDDTVHARVIENVLEKFLTQYSVYSDAYIKNSIHDNNEDKTTNSKDSKLLVFDQVHVGTISQFIFQVASDEEGVAKDLYRKNLYAVHKMYVRRIHQMGEDKDVDLRSNTKSNENHHNHHVHDENCLCEDDDSDDDDDDESDNTNSQVEENDTKDNIDNDNIELVDGVNNDNIDDNNEEEDAELSSHEEEPPEKPVAAEKKLKSGMASKTEPMPKKTVQVESSIKEAMSKETDQVTSSESSEKKRKKGKKKRKKEKSLADSTEEHPSEEITITAADQQAARKALQSAECDETVAKQETFTSGNKKRKQDAAQAKKDEAEAAQKRVKFGDMNRARSWQASMKALREMDVGSKLKGTPEKGILLNKGRKVVTKNHSNNKASKKGGRKKAKEYF